MYINIENVNEVYEHRYMVEGAEGYENDLRGFVEDGTYGMVAFKIGYAQYQDKWPNIDEIEEMVRDIKNAEYDFLNN